MHHPHIGATYSIETGVQIMLSWYGVQQPMEEEVPLCSHNGFGAVNRMPLIWIWVERPLANHIDHVKRSYQSLQKDA